MTKRIRVSNPLRYQTVLREVGAVLDVTDTFASQAVADGYAQYVDDLPTPPPPDPFPQYVLESELGAVGGGGPLTTVDSGEAVKLVAFSGQGRAVKNVPVSTPAPLPPGLLAPAVRLSSVTLSWTAPSTPVGQYAVFREGVQIGTTTDRTYKDTSIAAGATYHYTVRTIDPFGQVSPASNSVTAFIDPAINSAPTLDVTFWPPELPTVGRGYVRLAATDPDGQTLALGATADGGALTPTDDPSVFTTQGVTDTLVVHATVADPLGASDAVDATAALSAETGVRTIRTSFLGTRINWGNAITEDQQGPFLAEDGSPDPYNPIGPITLGFTASAMEDCRCVGVELTKMPTQAGNIIVAMWKHDGTLLAQKPVTWVADEGGKREYFFDAPIEMDANTEYDWGYFYPTADSMYAFSSYVWNTQDTVVYPLHMKSFGVTGGGVKQGGTWYKVGSSLTFSAASADRYGHNFYVNPIVERDVTIPGYDRGQDDTYWDQWPHGGSRFAFPIGIYWADPPYLDDYFALGINTLWAGSVSPAYLTALKAIVGAHGQGMDWYPTLHGNDMSAPLAVQEDPVLASMVRGYMLTDEPEFNSPWHSPADLRGWRNNARRIDSTRPINLNMSRITAENQGFTWYPAGINPRDVNLQWREYMSLADWGSLDCYGIAHTYPYSWQANDSKRYGIWIYPLVIRRMREQITDDRMPLHGVIETTSSYANSPTPEQVKRAVWSCLIEGVEGIEYFDHRFSSPVVSQDFAAMLNDVPMKTAVQALNVQMTTMAPVLLAKDAGLIEGYTSTGLMTKPQGGYAKGMRVPMHYTSRVVGGTTYFFCQAIRDGETTATFYVPGFEGATLTVIGEGRTVTVDGTGHFTDAFDDGDYTYHLYSTTAAPSFTAPANTVAPSISTDGTPQTGETITVAPGTWTGVPSPTFAYQWQSSTDDGATWTPIVGATGAGYVILVADEGNKVRCVVTATNSEGSASANSNEVSPTASTGPTPSGYQATVLALGPTFLGRMKDLVDVSGNTHVLTPGTSAPTLAPSIITDPSDNSRHFDNTGTQNIRIPDAPDLRLSGQAGFSAEVWIKPSTPGAFLNIMSKFGDFYLVQMGSNKIRFEVRGAAGWYGDCDTVSAFSVGDTVHIVGTWDLATKTIKIYYNGVLETTVDASTWGYAPVTSGWGGLALGYNSDTGTTGYAIGDLDAPAIYQRVLSDAEILANYQAGVA